VTVGTGADYVDLGDGNNILTATTGTAADSVFSGSGNDTIYLGAGSDIVDAGAGNDVINLGNGENIVYGGGGNDSILGGSGNDAIWGDYDPLFNPAATGNDTVNVGSGTDMAILGNGNDVFIIDSTYIADTAADMVDGGAGFDALVFQGTGVSMDLTLARFGNANFDNFERIDLTGTGNNSLTLAANDVLELTDKAAASAVLVIDGNAGDAVTGTGFGALAGSGKSVWVDLNGDGINNAGDFSGTTNASSQVTFTGPAGAQTYYVYQNTGTYGTLLVDTDMTRSIT
jgi:Ca2+-binding RTX toxin-like protein